MNERLIQIALWNDRLRNWTASMPNYTPDGWFECDVWAVTNAGYVTEFEIKLTVADFLNDAHKRLSGYEAKRIPMGELSKHERLAAGDPLGPSRFVYVVAETIVKPVREALPDWAGLYSARALNKRYIQFTEIKSPPRLHMNKVGDGDTRQAMRRAYFRYWATLGRLHRSRV